MAQEINSCTSPDIVNSYSSAALAFLGDSVFELTVRAMITSNFKGNAASLNKKSKALTNARTQSHMAELLKDILSQEELSVYKRGRNFKAPSVPKSCTVSEYRRATGLEALMGFLYISNRQERIEMLVREGIRMMENEVKIEQ